jgi:hypothetical protein
MNSYIKGIRFPGLVLLLAGFVAEPLFSQEKPAIVTPPAAPAPAATPVAPATAPATTAPPAAPATEKVEKAEKPEKADGAEKAVTPAKRKKKVIKLADDKEEQRAPVRDPATYELSNKKMVDDFNEFDRHPYDRGEHILISTLFGAFGGAVVGGMTGFYAFDKNDETKSKNALYTFGGVGAGVGALGGLAVSFFERRQIEQFGIGKFLLKYSWYGAFGGALIGAGVGMIPYASSGDYSDIIRNAGYGAGAGFIAGLALFFIDLPDHLKIFSYRRDDQNTIVLALRF